MAQAPDNERNQRAAVYTLDLYAAEVSPRERMHPNNTDAYPVALESRRRTVHSALAAGYVALLLDAPACTRGSRYVYPLAMSDTSHTGVPAEAGSGSSRPHLLIYWFCRRRKPRSLTLLPPILAYANQPLLPVGRLLVTSTRCGISSTFMPLRRATT